MLDQLLSGRGTAGPVSGWEHYCPRREKSWLHCRGGDGWGEGLSVCEDFSFTG